MFIGFYKEVDLLVKTLTLLSKIKSILHWAKMCFETKRAQAGGCQCKQMCAKRCSEFASEEGDLLSLQDFRQPTWMQIHWQKVSTFINFPFKATIKLLYCAGVKIICFGSISESIRILNCICQVSTNPSLLCLIKHIVHIWRAHMVFDFTSQLTNDWRLMLQRHMKRSFV